MLDSLINVKKCIEESNEMNTFMVTHIPEGVATVFICEVDLLRCNLDFLLDVNNWTGSGRTELSEQLYNHRSNQRRVVREKIPVLAYL